MAATVEDDHCAVCAEPMAWAAYGRCGHRDACSKCVVRMRAVLRDTRCVICQQPADAVVVTRAAGAYTRVLPPEAFDELKVRKRKGKTSGRRRRGGVPATSCTPSLFSPLSLVSPQAKARSGALHKLGGGTAVYFEDAAHFATLKELTSFTHEALRGWDPDARGGAGGPSLDRAAPPPRFPDLKTLEAALQAYKGLRFCPLCLAGRKVFVSEQVAYTKAGLAAHSATGDADGPLAEAGFSGHPACRFCRGARFYGEGELYVHMQTAHEHCFLCRRARPTEHVYWRDYADLARHFSAAHHACGEAACLERRFVVFGTPAELGAHMAGEHGEALSKAERRAALTIEIDRPRYDGGGGNGARGGGGRAGGGGGARTGGNGPSSSSTGLGGAAALRAARAAGSSRPDLAAAAVDGPQAGPAPPPPRPPSPPPRLGADDFPAALGGPAPPSAAGVLAARQAGVIRSARWAAAAGGGLGGGGGGGGGLATDEFPALGGGSKGAPPPRRRRPPRAWLPRPRPPAPVRPLHPPPRSPAPSSRAWLAWARPCRPSGKPSQRWVGVGVGVGVPVVAAPTAVPARARQRSRAEVSGSAPPLPRRPAPSSRRRTFPPWAAAAAAGERAVVVAGAPLHHHHPHLPPLPPASPPPWRPPTRHSSPG